MAEDSAASLSERLIEACRRNNLDLLEEVLQEDSTPEFLNSATDALGNTALHTASIYGSVDAIDVLLDSEGLEVDPVNTLDQDTPLHVAVRAANNMKDNSLQIVDLLVEAGSDVKVQNKHGQMAIDLADPRWEDLIAILKRAALFQHFYDDTVDEEITHEDHESDSESD